MQQKMEVRVNVLLVLAYGFLIHPLVDTVHSIEENCFRGDLYDYDNPCASQPGQPQKLDLCLEGQRLAERCTENCVYCEAGISFSDSFNNCLNCKPCRTESECPKGQVITRPCTIISDAECGCPPQPCPTSPPSTCEPCPPVAPCPTTPTQTEDVPETSSPPQIPLRFTQNCPPGIDKWTDDDGSNKSVSWVEPQVTPGSKLVHQTYKPGHYFPIGHFEVVYVFANTSGDTISCGFPITVKAPVKPTDQPLLAGPVEECFMLIVIAFIFGAVITFVILLLSWFYCYRKKCLFLKKLCPNYAENEDDEKEEREAFIHNGPNARGDGNQNANDPIQPQANCINNDNHQQAAGNLAQADEGCNDNKDPDTELQKFKENGTEIEREKNPQNGTSGPNNVGQETGGQQDNGHEEDSTQQSSLMANKSSSQSDLRVDLPPENPSSMSPETLSQLEPSSSQVEEQHTDSTTNIPPQSPLSAGLSSLPPYENLSTSLKNPDVEVTEEDIDWIAGRVDNNSSYYDGKDTFIRSVIGYDKQKRIAENLEKTDRRTQLFRFLYEGWLSVASSRKRSDLALKLRKFNKSLEQDFIKYINEQDKS